VNDVAGSFGGGGHNFAAGAQIEGPLDEALALIVNACLAKVGASTDVW